MGKPKYEFDIASYRSLEYEEDAEKLNNAITLHMKNADDLKWPKAIEWFRNASFLAGNHYDHFRWTGHSLQQSTPTVPSRFLPTLAPQQIDNCIFRAVQSNISSLTGFNPTPRITPASLTADDRDLAKIGGLLIKLLWERPLRVPARLREAVLYAMLTGTAGLEVSFGELNSVESRLKKKKVKVPGILGDFDEELIDSDEIEWIYRNGLKINVHSGFHIDVNPDANVSSDSLTWVCRSSYEDITLIKRYFDRDEKFYLPENARKLQGGEAPNHPLWYWERIRSIVDSGEHTTRAPDNRVPTQSVLVRYIDTLPNLEFPLGRTLVQAGGQLVYAGPGRACSEKYKDRWHPYNFIRWGSIGGRFDGTALITELVKHQKRINVLDCLIRISRQQMTIGGWLIPKSAKIPDGFVGGVPGQNVVFNDRQGAPLPTPIPYHPLPADIWQERAIHVGAIDRMAGIVNAGSEAFGAQSGLRSGSMLSFFERQATSAKSAILRELEDSIDDLAQNILIEANLNLNKMPELRRRLLVAARNESDLAIERFEELDIRDNIHVTLDIRAQQSQTPEAKQEAAGLFLQYAGKNMSPVERAKIAQLMGLDEIDTQVSNQYLRAQRMVERILQGDTSFALSLEGVDDPVVFSQVIRDALLTEKALTASKEVKEALMILLEEYKAQLPALAPQVPPKPEEA